MTALALYKDGLCLRPTDEHSRASLSKISQGQEVLAEIKARRNVRRHRLAWGIISLVHENTKLVPTPENLMECAKQDLGHVEVLTHPFTGETWTRPKSINFASMDEIAFAQFLDGLIELVCNNWLVGIDRMDLRQAVFEIVDGPGALGRRI